MGDAGEAGPYGDMDLSPDGKLIAVTKQDAGSPGSDIWVIDWQRAGVAYRLTLDPSDDINPVWSPDGKRIAFTTYRKGNADIYVAENGTGVGKETPLLESATDEIVKDWSKDGKYIAYLTGQDNFQDIYALPMTDGKPDADKKPFPVVQGHFQKSEPQFSYDGKWLAYTSDRTVPGMFQVYVRSFPAGDQEIAVSTAGGGQPRWRKDGKELYYRAPDDNIMAVEIQAGARLEAGIPHPLFLAVVRAIEAGNPTRHVLAVTPDGQRFLLRIPAGSGGRGSTFGNSGVPEAPVIAATSGSAASAAGAGRGGIGSSALPVTGLTMIQHWAAALGKAQK
jgi:Tol biopolymer transport system component